MPIAAKRWNIRTACPADHLARYAHLHRLLAQVLYNRGVTDPEDVAAFLESRLRFDDPYRLAGMEKAVFAIDRAIRKEAPICVYGDFDADGVTSTALLVTVLKALGARVSHYIPHRVDEGYGVHAEALDKICETGVKLVITVDCCIRSAAEVRHAKQRNMAMIVTDHHDLGPELPPAYAVINPKQEGCQFGARFKGLAGVGIAFKLSQALLRKARDDGREAALLDEELYDLVALGTVADVAPLLQDNRYLVQRGLERLRLAKRPGIFAMLSEAKLLPQRVDATAIGFILGPRLNAAGRLDTAETSYDLLTCGEPARATELAARIGELNRQRQSETQSLVNIVRAQIAEEGPDRYLHFAVGAGFKRGVVGLAAGRLCEELYRPVLVAEQNGEYIYGSARSIPEFNITAALDRVFAEDPSLLVRYGGHDVAAGFTAPAASAPELASRLEELAASGLAGQELSPVLDIDAEVSLGELDYAVQELLSQLEPCGQDNRQPILWSRGLIVAAQRPVGQEQQHLKLTLRDPNLGGRGAGLSWDAIAFRQGEWYGRLPDRIDVAFVLEVNEFNGERRLQLNVKDIRPAAA